MMGGHVMDANPTSPAGPARTSNFGRYHLIRRVSVGGMAEIFKAKAMSPGGFEKIVAVKRLLPHVEEDPVFVQHFMSESKLVAILDHPLVARIYEVGQVGQTPYLAMEFVYGVDLQELMRVLTELGRPTDPRLVCALGIQAAHALDYAHHVVDEAGRPCEIVHRDVSPQNFMMSSTGELKLIDFGIAKFAGREGQTKTGIVKGKHAYMSPEQVRRRPLDGRSDLFSLGVILWELACGERLFRADSVLETLERVDSAQVTPPIEVCPDMPPALSAWIMRCLARSRDDRPHRAAVLAQGLEGLLKELDPETWDACEAHPGIAQAMTTVATFYSELFGERGTLEDDLTLDEYRQALRLVELGEDAQLNRRNPSDITIVPDTTDLAEYVARLRERLVVVSPVAESGDGGSVDGADQRSDDGPTSFTVDTDPTSATGETARPSVDAQNDPSHTDDPPHTDDPTRA
jgi:serine/threonine-protein kinase